MFPARAAHQFHGRLIAINELARLRIENRKRIGAALEEQTKGVGIRAECRRLVVGSPAGDVRCTCSIGISEVETGDQNIDAVLRRADAALYDAKRSGRDCWKSYSPETENLLASA